MNKIMHWLTNNFLLPKIIRKRELRKAFDTSKTEELMQKKEEWAQARNAERAPPPGPL